MPKQNEQQNKDISSIKTDIVWIKQDINDIKNNHLTTIYQELKEIKKTLSERPGWLVAGVMSILVGLVVYFLTH